MRAVVLGGGGFLGSHLVDALLARGDEVVAVDSFVTGNRSNLAHLEHHERFTLVEADVINGIPVSGRVDAVLHFASPASPPRYLALPIETLHVNSIGTEHALRLATDHGARFLLASTSEVYGDPVEHPQRETYWGNVNPIGPRSVYDEAKRYGEAIAFAFHRTHGTDISVVRIFNTYGPRLDPYDGRVVSTLLRQAIAGEPLTVYGDGTQTRSFCYVEDEVRGFLALLDRRLVGPVNIGNPTEFTMLELADAVRAATGADVPVVFEPLPQDDPKQRRPDITLAREQLDWEPQIDLAEGLRRTAAWFSALNRA